MRRLRIYSWLYHLLFDLGQATTSLWVLVTSFLSALGSKEREGEQWPAVFREVYVVLMPEGEGKAF